MSETVGRPKALARVAARGDSPRGGGVGGSLGPLCPAESEFLGWSSEPAFVANFPNAYSACRAMDLIHFLSFPDGETEAHRGEGTYPQSQGCGMARPGLLTLPAGVFFLISPRFLECGIFHRDPDPVLWYEISETRVFRQKFRPSPLYWKKGILWSQGFAVPPPPYPGPACSFPAQRGPTGSWRGLLVYRCLCRPVTRWAAGKTPDTDRSVEKLPRSRGNPGGQ